MVWWCGGLCVRVCGGGGMVGHVSVCVWVGGEGGGGGRGLKKNSLDVAIFLSPLNPLANPSLLPPLFPPHTLPLLPGSVLLHVPRIKMHPRMPIFNSGCSSDSFMMNTSRPFAPVCSVNLALHCLQLSQPLLFCFGVFGLQTNPRQWTNLSAFVYTCWLVWDGW